MWHLSFSFCLTSLSMITSGPIHVAANGIFHSCFVAELYSTEFMGHIFFIHSSVDGHLDCFHVFMSWLLWIMLLWTYACVYLFVLLFRQGVYPGVGLPGPTGKSFFFWGPSKLFSRKTSFKTSFCLDWLHSLHHAIDWIVGHISVVLKYSD